LQRLAVVQSENIQLKFRIDVRRRCRSSPRFVCS